MSRTRNERNRHKRLWRAYNAVVLGALVIDTAFLGSYLTKCNTDDHTPTYVAGEVQHAEVVDAIMQPTVEFELEIPDEVVEQTRYDELAEVESYANTCAFDYEYVLRVVAAECRGEPYEGQMAVAQCILNTAWERGMTPEEVVKEKNQYASPVKNLEYIELVRDACDAVFFDGETVTDEPIRYFYSVRKGFVSKWHENNLEFVVQIGNHKFFKEVE